MTNREIITGYNHTPIGTFGQYVQMDDGMQLEESLRISSNANITTSDNQIVIEDHGYRHVITINEDGSEIFETLSYGSDDLHTKYIHIRDSEIEINENAPNTAGGDGE